MGYIFEFFIYYIKLFFIPLLLLFLISIYPEIVFSFSAASFFVFFSYTCETLLYIHKSFIVAF